MSPRLSLVYLLWTNHVCIGRRVIPSVQHQAPVDTQRDQGEETDEPTGCSSCLSDVTVEEEGERKGRNDRRNNKEIWET